MRSHDSYARAMLAQPPHLTLTIETTQPIELGDFVGAFTSIASEYERFVRAANPDWRGSAQIYVKEVRAGSIIADLIPAIILTSLPLIEQAGSLMLIEDFVRRWGTRLRALIVGTLDEQPKSRAELRDFSDAVQAIANDPNGSATLEAAMFEDGRRKIKAAFKFNTQEARSARAETDKRLIGLEQKTTAERERVLMVFARADISDVQVGRASGELVKIEEIHEKPRALIYASAMAEERIKHETRSPESIFKKGFVVDVNIRLNDGRPVAYSVTNVHQVIDLPDD